MSIINSWITKTEALVAVDTEAVTADGLRAPWSKLLTIPHLNVAMANQGQGAFLNFLYLKCLTEGLRSFDELLEALPLLVMETDLFMPQEFISHHGDHTGNRLIVVGWSDREKSMLGRAYVKDAATNKYASSDFECVITPWDDSLPDIPKKIGNLEKIARAQVRWLLSGDGMRAGGGELIVCRITKKSVETRHVLSFQAERKAA